MNHIVAAAAAVAAGTGIGLGRAGLARPFTLLTIGALVVAAIVRKRHTVALVCVVVALGTASGASASWRTAGSSDALMPRLAGRGVLAEACGTVRVRKPRSVEIQADQVSARGKRWRTREPLRVSGAKTAAIRPGERICARGPVVAGRPGRDEAPLVAARQLSRAGQGSAIRSAAASVRHAFSEAAQRALPPTQAGLLLGMTDGDVELLDERTVETFRTTGLAHLVAVSGSNVAVVLVIVLLLSRALVRRGRWLRVLIAGPVLVFFAFLTGLEASVLRAVFTAGVALAIGADGRTADAIRVSAFAFIVLVLATPEMLVHPGFQLSFVATIGLILWASPLAERIGRVLPDGSLGRATAVATATTVAAQAAVAPLLAWHFGRVPAVGGVANLIVAPLAPVVMIGGTITLGAASLVSALEWLPAVMRLPLDVILGCARWFSELPAASFSAHVLAGVAVTAVLAALLARDRRLRVGATAIAVGAAAIVGGRAAARTDSCSGAGVHALDVGQGTAVVLESDGHTVLVDAGPAYGGVVSQLDAIGVTALDALIVTHPHVDHALGAVDVLKRLDVGRVVGPVTLGWGGGKQVIDGAADANVDVDEVAAGDSLSLGPIDIDVLWPEAGPAPRFDEDLVDPYSLVLRARIAGVSILLPGDIRAEQQSELADDDVAVSLLIAVHHGSKNLDRGFVDAVAPRLTLVTVGAPNPYGLPAPEAIEAYSRHGPVFRTDQDGRVSVCLDADGAGVITQR